MFIKNNVLSSFYFRIQKLLITKPLKETSYILSHGGIHLILLIGLSFLIAYFFKLSITEVGPQYHEIQLSLSNDQNNKFDYLSINAQIASDSLYLKKGYSQSIQIHYRPHNNINNNDSITQYSTTFNINRYPFHTKLAFSDDLSLSSENKIIRLKNYSYKVNTFTDSTIQFTRYSGTKKFIQKFHAVPQTFIIYGNDLLSPSIEKDNPYYYFFLRLDFNYDIPDSLDYCNYYYISVIFGDFKLNGTDARLTKPLKYQYIYPEPDHITSGSIEYISKHKINEVLKNRGILVQVEDINLKNRNDRIGFIYAILLGAMVAFWLDIFVNLVIKWRNLNLKLSNTN